MISPLIQGEKAIAACNAPTGQTDPYSGSDTINGSDLVSFLNVFISLITIFNPTGTHSSKPEEAKAQPVQNQQSKEQSLTINGEGLFLISALPSSGTATCQCLNSRIASNSATVLAEKSGIITPIPSPPSYPSSRAIVILPESRFITSAKDDKEVDPPTTDDFISLLKGRSVEDQELGRMKERQERLSNLQDSELLDILQIKSEKRIRIQDNMSNSPSIIFNEWDGEGSESPSQMTSQLINIEVAEGQKSGRAEARKEEKTEGKTFELPGVRAFVRDSEIPSFRPSGLLSDIPESLPFEIDTPPVSDPPLLDLDVKSNHDPDLSALQVTVKHDGLGELDIKLVLNKGIINGQIKTPEVATADLLIRNMPEIINSLISDGLNIGDLSVSLKDSSRGYRETYDTSKSVDREEAPRRQNSDLLPLFIGSGNINIFV